MIGALVIGSALAVGALAFVLYPVFFPVARGPAAVPPPRGNERDTAVDALREIEFDRATGKLSDDDYSELKTRYTGQAIVAMRRQEAVGTEPIADLSRPPAIGAPSDEELEAVVRAFRDEQRGCPACGPRPEPDALFCSNCGRYLHDRCAGCGAPVVAPDARFCISCGSRLAA
jgi:hypothetical protein